MSNTNTQTLQPFTGKWDAKSASHLLRRAQFGARYEEIEQAAKAGLEPTVQRLLTPQPAGDEFTKTEAMLKRSAHDSSNIADLKAWWLYRMVYSPSPLAEKMTLFWHNHFATSNTKVGSVAHMAAQNDLLRQHALGSFGSLLHGIARDVAMLIWLDSNSNKKRQPNENFSRELMELFSLGVGNYTEKDIKEAGRAFTGWHIREGKFWFDRDQHDFGAKTVFGKRGDWNGDDVVEQCLQHDACPRFLAAKLLRTFVTGTPVAALIEPLAASIRRHDFAMDKVLRELFTSEMFYRPESRAAIIKSPVDLVIGSQRALAARVNLQATAQLLAELGQDLFQPPTVKGWDGGRLWINSAMLLKRASFAAEIATGNRFGEIADLQQQMKDRQLATSEAIARHYAEWLLATVVEPAAAARLGGYLQKAPGDRAQAIRGMIHLVMTMPEYQFV